MSTKKKYKFSELSDRKCTNPLCGSFLKKNLLDKNPHAMYCWKCTYTTRISRRLGVPAYKVYIKTKRVNDVLKVLKLGHINNALK